MGRGLGASHSECHKTAESLEEETHDATTKTEEKLRWHVGARQSVRTVVVKCGDLKKPNREQAD